VGQARRALARGGVAATPDFEALLEGLDGEARAARLDLLEQLSAAGVSRAELERAVAENRLALLPVERVLGAGARYTLGEVAERSGLDADSILAHRLAFGLARPAADDVAFTEQDLADYRTVRQFRDAGLPEEGLLEVARVVGPSLARIAEVMRRLVADAFLRAGDTERDLGLRYAEAAANLAPLLGPLLDNGLNAHLRQLIATDAVDRAEMREGRIIDADQVAVCFADLVGFTTLGELMPADELAAVAGRLEVLAAAVAQRPVRLVKMIGDAAMLVSPEPRALLDGALELVDAAAREGDEFPALRAGIALGPALNRGGDWYGRTVNLGSRIASVAGPGEVLVTEEVRAAIGDGYTWSDAGRHRLKGVAAEVALLRVG
jgi:adenylate cyclase